MVIWGSSTGAIEGDTRTLDYSPPNPKQPRGLGHDRRQATDGWRDAQPAASSHSKPQPGPDNGFEVCPDKYSYSDLPRRSKYAILRFCGFCILEIIVQVWGKYMMIR